MRHLNCFSSPSPPVDLMRAHRIQPISALRPVSSAWNLNPNGRAARWETWKGRVGLDRTGTGLQD
jgi:hypothetical protein